MLFFPNFQQIQILLGTAPSHARLCEEGSLGAFFSKIKVFFFKFPPEKKKNATEIMKTLKVRSNLTRA